jgi:hypothetical protein
MSLAPQTPDYFRYKAVEVRMKAQKMSHSNYGAMRQVAELWEWLAGFGDEHNSALIAPQASRVERGIRE